MPNSECRISQLEGKFFMHLDAFKSHQEWEEEQRQLTNSILLELKSKIDKQAGFWAGASFVVTAIAGVGMAVYQKFWG